MVSRILTDLTITIGIVVASLLPAVLLVWFVLWLEWRAMKDRVPSNVIQLRRKR